jgi:hypothetical protein
LSSSRSMTRLESYGDSLKKDEYRCHSRFKQAVNFFNGDSMAALVDRTIGPGPHHIIIAGIDPQQAERLAITADELLLDGIRYPLASGCRYDSRLELDGAIDRERFGINLEYFARGLGQSAPPESMAFLLERRRKPRRGSALERSITGRLAAGSKLIFNGNFFAGVKMCKGLGFGLTPSGDDFIGGILLALYYGQKLFVRNFELTIKAACRLTRGGNPFSNTMMAYAGEGRAIGKIKDLLAALFYGAEKDVFRCTDDLRSIGHSSGIDFGVGLSLTFNKLNRSQGEAWW